MRCIAVISEFNPFHNGHGHLFDEIRRRTEDECVLCCVMSGNFTQRGDCALFAKSERAAMAADEGADLVVELPFPWSMASAEFFARAGVAIAAAMGADTLAFGAETPDDTLFDRIGKILADDAFTLKLTGLLRAPKSRGIPYAILRQQLLMQLLPDITSDFFRSPNNILGLEYSRAIHSRKDPIALMSIPRAGGSYHGPLTQHAYFAGASAIRAQLAEGDFDRVRPYLPRDTFDRVVSLMQSGQYSRGPEVLWPLLAHRLLTGSETGIADFCGNFIHSEYGAVDIVVPGLEGCQIFGVGVHIAVKKFETGIQPVVVLFKKRRLRQVAAENGRVYPDIETGNGDARRKDENPPQCFPFPRVRAFLVVECLPVENIFRHNVQR